MRGDFAIEVRHEAGWLSSRQLLLICSVQGLQVRVQKTDLEGKETFSQSLVSSPQATSSHWASVFSVSIVTEAVAGRRWRLSPEASPKHPTGIHQLQIDGDSCPLG